MRRYMGSNSKRGPPTGCYIVTVSGMALHVHCITWQTGCVFVCSAVGFSCIVIQGRFPENSQGHRHHHGINFLHGTNKAADPKAESISAMSLTVAMPLIPVNTDSTRSKAKSVLCLSSLSVRPSACIRTTATERNLKSYLQFFLKPVDTFRFWLNCTTVTLHTKIYIR